MGASGTKKAVKPELSQAQIDNLKARTRMSEEEIQKIHESLNQLSRTCNILKSIVKSNELIETITPTNNMQQIKEQFHTLVDYVESLSTRLALACEGCVVASDCVPFIEQMEKGITGLMQTIQVIFAEARAGLTLKNYICKSCDQLLDSVCGVCEALKNGLTGEALAVKTGLVWNSCKVLKDSPVSNKVIIGKFIYNNISLLNDTYEELEEVINAEDYSGDGDDGDDGDENDKNNEKDEIKNEKDELKNEKGEKDEIKNKDDEKDEMKNKKVKRINKNNDENDNSNENDGSNEDSKEIDDPDYVDNEYLTKEEKLVIPPVMNLVNIARESLTNIGNLIKAAGPKSYKLFTNYVNWLEEVLLQSNDLLLHSDNLVAVIYTPEETDKMNENFSEVKQRIINLMELSITDISNILSKIPEDNILALQDLKSKIIDINLN